ncbi:MAG: PilZ domain-containing protein [Polyangiales bacterium]
MAYSGSETAKTARESLSKALEALQTSEDLPKDVLDVTSHIAEAVGALFEAERASSDLDGKASVRAGLGSLSQTLALLQDVKTEHPGIGVATSVIADAMSSLYPLTSVPSKAPSKVPSKPASKSPEATAATLIQAPQAAPLPNVEVSEGRSLAPAPRRSLAPPPPPPIEDAARVAVEANIGATTESNFFVGFTGEISDGGVFLATYEVLAANTGVNVLVTLPGGFETRIKGWVRFVRDPMDLDSDSEPGLGIQFENLNEEQRELILRFIRKRPPMFYDD